MMRALWTAASGMTTQQTNVDTISNNLANVNTVGYKKETAQFKTLLYQTIQQKQTNSDGEEKPLSAQVGLGTRTAAIRTEFTQGPRTKTEGKYDFAIQGDGFFTVRMPDGSTAYTRSGAFQMAIGADGLTLATSEGYPVLDTNGNPIVIPEQYNVNDVSFDSYGNLCVKDDKNQPVSTGIQIGLVQFSNPAGLEKGSNSMLFTTNSSGEPMYEVSTADMKRSEILQGYLEGSNVQTVDEMVNLIVAQRAYEMNSKIITASDEMLQQANNLRR